MTIGGQVVPARLSTASLCAWRGGAAVLNGVSLAIDPGLITAVIGPASSGKSTLLQCFNRLHDLEPGARRSGELKLNGESIDALSPERLRQRVGMLFSRPQPFSALSVRENVLVGLRLAGRPIPDGGEWLVEQLLQRVELWEVLRGRLNRSTAGLTPGQQQRLCLARALALSPEVLLLDEPCAGLDPIETAELEDALQRLRGQVTLVLATQSVQHAARVSDRTAVLLSGELVEVGSTERLFTSPQDPRTEDYITGRFSF